MSSFLFLRYDLDLIVCLKLQVFFHSFGTLGQIRDLDKLAIMFYKRPYQYFMSMYRDQFLTNEMLNKKTSLLLVKVSWRVLYYELDCILPTLLNKWAN